MPKFSIKSFFAVATLLLFSIGLAVTVALVLSTLHQRFKETIGETIRTLVVSHAATLDARFDSAKGLLRDVALTLPENTFSPDQAPIVLARQKLALNTFDLGLYLLSPDNLILADLLADPENGVVRRGERALLGNTRERARETGIAQISPPYASPSCKGCPAVAIFMPVFNNRKVLIGYLVGAIRLTGENFLAALSKTEIGEEGYMYLLTPDRKFVMHPDSSRRLGEVLQPGSNLLIDEVLAERRNGYSFTVNSRGMPQIVAFQFMKSTGWLLAAVYSQDEAERPFSAAKTQAVVIALAVGALFLIAIWILVWRILSPLVVLSRHVVEVPGSGNFERLNLKGAIGEIASLEYAFNQMLTELSHQRDKQSQTEAEIRSLNAGLLASNAELQSAMQRLQQMQAELVESEKMAALGSLVVGVSHELNTPIGNCVLVSSQLREETSRLAEAFGRGDMRRSSLSAYIEMQQSGIQIIERNIESVAQLVQRFKQIAVDRSTEARCQFKLGKVVQETVTLLAKSGRLGPCNVDIKVHADITMDSFPGRLGDVLDGLIENAVIHAYSGKPSGLIEILAETNEKTVVIEVRDRGCGISETDLHKVFDPFFTTRLGQGTSGLGLSVIYNTVTGLLGGRINVRSEPGEGTAFVLHVPVVAPG